MLCGWGEVHVVVMRRLSKKKESPQPTGVELQMELTHTCSPEPDRHCCYNNCKACWLLHQDIGRLGVYPFPAVGPFAATNSAPFIALSTVGCLFENQLMAYLKSREWLWLGTLGSCHGGGMHLYCQWGPLVWEHLRKLPRWHCHELYLLTQFLWLEIGIFGLFHSYSILWWSVFHLWQVVTDRYAADC